MDIGAIKNPARVRVFLIEPKLGVAMLLEQREHRLRLLVGLRQHGGAGLLDDL